MRKEKKATALLKILCYSKGYEGKTMNYKNTIRGIFKDRPNRFIAHVQIGDQLETVHVKNTGRSDQCEQGGPLDQYGFPGPK